MKIPDGKALEAITASRLRKFRYFLILIVILAAILPTYYLGLKILVSIKLCCWNKTPVFYQDFENNVVITFLSDNETGVLNSVGGGYNLERATISNEEALIEITDEKALSGNKSLLCTSLAGFYTGQGLFVQLPRQDNFTIQFDIILANNAGGKKDHTETGSGVAICGNMQFPGKLPNNLVSFKDSGEIFFREDRIFKQWSPDTQYHVAIRIDLKSDSYAAYMSINGWPFRNVTHHGLNLMGIIPEPVPSKKIRIWFFADAVSCYLDNITIY